MLKTRNWVYSAGKLIQNSFLKQISDLIKFGPWKTWYVTQNTWDVLYRSLIVLYNRRGITSLNLVMAIDPPVSPQAIWRKKITGYFGKEKKKKVWRTPGRSNLLIWWDVKRARQKNALGRARFLVVEAFIGKITCLTWQWRGWRGLLGEWEKSPPRGGSGSNYRFETSRVSIPLNKP